MSTEPFDLELTELARRLRDMPPAPAELSRDRLMFLAGQAVGKRRRRAWQAGVGVGLMAAGLLLGVQLPREPVVVVRVRPAPSAAPVVKPPAPPADAMAAGLPSILPLPSLAATETSEESPLWRQRMQQLEATPADTS